MARGDSGAAPTSAQGFRFTACLILVVLFASLTQLLPAGALPGWLQGERSSMSVVWPQGWDFFDDEPTADATVALGVGDGGRLTAVTQVQMDRSTDWGLSRSGYARYVELAGLSGQIAPGDWLDCTRLDPDECRRAALQRPLVHSVNHTAHPALCGHVLVALASPLRWTADTRLWQRDWKIHKIVNSDFACAG